MAMRLLGPVFLIGGQDYNMVYMDWPANDANVYLVNTGDTFVLVDCGCGESLPGILGNVRQMEFDPRDISHLLLTHEHFPHAGAAEAVQKMGIEVVAGEAAAEVVRNGGLSTAAYYYHRKFAACDEMTVVDDGEEIVVGGVEFTALYLPGHSLGCVGYEMVTAGQRMLFCGDVVRSPLLESCRDRIDYDWEAYVASLEMLLDDPPDVLYPGHGPFCLSRGDVWIEEELKKVLAFG
jgi:glyoxylase-like metal-dependent hydrolase (beta-lactamase superfamily II)